MIDFIYSKQIIYCFIPPLLEIGEVEIQLEKCHSNFHSYKYL